MIEIYFYIGINHAAAIDKAMGGNTYILKGKKILSVYTKCLCVHSAKTVYHRANGSC